MKKHTVSVIVPAYNEEKTIKDVLTVLKNAPSANEIICINDGSTDNTEQILKQFEKDVTVINLKENNGKGNALAIGIKKAKGDIIVFLDADLVSLSDQHIKQLISPLLEDDYKAVIGYMVNKVGISVFTEISGQRAYFRADLLPYLEDISKTRFGVEMFLNGLFTQKETKKIVLPGLDSLLKYQKQKPDVALKEYIKEVVEIVKVVGNTEILSDNDLQILKNLTHNITFEELRSSINRLKNIKIKEAFNKYVDRYIQIVREKS